MSDDLETRAPADLADIADDMAEAAREFVTVVESVAVAHSPDESVSILLLELSSLLASGAPLGAIVDVVPEERFEPDAGAEPDVSRLRDALAALLGPADEYVEVFDPYSGPQVVGARLSDDLADICADLLHGLAHHAAGRTLEALWWWQFSYLSTWGQGASAALRALQSLVAHVRLEVPLDVDPAIEA
jgi:Domain of unknown function (DUF5063)